MIKRILMVCTWALMAFACLGEGCPQLEALMCTTNLWSSSVEQYRIGVETNVAAIVLAEGEGAAAVLRRWYVPMLGLSVSTNEPQTYCTWVGVKENHVFKYGRLFVGGTNDLTDVWMAIADLLRETRAKVLGRQDLQMAAQSLARPSGGSAFADRRRSVLDLVTAQSANEGLAAVVRDIVVNDYGKRGIPQLPPECRMQTYSNLVERASLTTEEAQGILHAISEQ